MTALFIPPATTTHPALVPYISIEEYEHAPTAVDVSSLTSTGSSTDQAIELWNVIRRATRWANALCYQILAATQDTDTADDLYVRRDGTVRVSNTYWPMRELDSFSAGPTPSTMTPITNTADIWMSSRHTMVVPVGGLLRQAPNTLGYVVGPVRPGSRIYAQWTYWNGWFHTALAASCLQSALSLTTTSALPMSAAGAQLTLVDGALTEVVTVASNYTGGSTTLPLASPTVSAHTFSGYPQLTPVTELPEDVRQATISLTSALIKVRGTEGYVMPDLEGAEPTREALIEGGGLEDLAIAVDLLERYSRVA